MGVTQVPPRPGPPPTRPTRTGAPRELLERLGGDLLPDPEPARRRSRGGAVAAACQWLSGHPGGDWQQRWTATGSDACRGLGRCRAGPGRPRAELTGGVLLLVCLDALRPGYRWVAAQQIRVHHKRVLHGRAPDQFTALRAEAQLRGVPSTSVTAMMTLLTRMMVVTGRTPLQLAADDFTDYARMFQPNPRRRTLPLADRVVADPGARWPSGRTGDAAAVQPGRPAVGRRAGRPVSDRLPGGAGPAGALPIRAGAGPGLHHPAGPGRPPRRAVLVRPGTPPPPASTRCG